MNKGRRYFAAFLVSVVASQATAQGATQSLVETSQGARWQLSAAMGTTSIIGAGDASALGVFTQVTLLRRLASGRTSIRLDVPVHLFGAEALAPCLVTVGGTCWQTLQRNVISYTLSLQHAPGGGSAYFVVGPSVFQSARVLKVHSSCVPNSGCSQFSAERTLKNMDYGVSVGSGHTWKSGSSEFFLEARLYIPFTTDNGVDQLNNFKLLPVSFGIRF